MVSSLLLQFQSRNRGSFGFKSETLEIGSMTQGVFQSRNRGSFGFKLEYRRWEVLSYHVSIS